MKKMLTIAFLIGSSAMAQVKPYVGATKAVNPDYSEMYLADGKQVAEPEAFMSAIKGAKVYRCVIQEASMGKSGKSMSLKNVKKSQ